MTEKLLADPDCTEIETGLLTSHLMSIIHEGEVDIIGGGDVDGVYDGLTESNVTDVGQADDEHLYVEGEYTVARTVGKIPGDYYNPPAYETEELTAHFHSQINIVGLGEAVTDIEIY